MSHRDRFEREIRRHVERSVEHGLSRYNERAQRRHERRVRRRRRRGGVFRRLLRAALWMGGATAVIGPAMLFSGRLLGPLGREGLLLTPLILIATWGSILYYTLVRRTPVRVIVKADIPQLPERTAQWLDDQHHLLPPAAESSLESLSQRLISLQPQLETLDARQPIAHELRRLLGEELPELVRGYQKVPAKLQQQPLHGGASPERQLLEGLRTIDEQLGRIQ